MARQYLVLLLLSGCLIEGAPDGEDSAVATRIAAGNGTFYAVTSTGSVRAWGAGQHAGIPDAGQLRVPTTIPGLESGVKDISSYGDTTCVLMVDGTVECWGDNNDGTVGDGTTAEQPVPTPVPGLSGVTSLSMGAKFACVVVNGGVKCWGLNDSHELGLGDPDELTDAPMHSYTPVDVPGLESGVDRVVAGYFHACAFMHAGPLTCWGDNEFGELGIGENHRAEEPVYVGDPLPQMTGITNPRDVALGYGWAILATDTGVVKSLGNDVDEQVLGLGPDHFGDEPLPLDVIGVPTGAAAVSDLCAIVNGEAWCWSQSQTPDARDAALASKIPGITNAVQITGGPTTCVLDTEGAIRCWGTNGVGEVGDGSMDQSVDNPAPVLSFP